MADDINAEVASLTAADPGAPSTPAPPAAGDGSADTGTPAE